MRISLRAVIACLLAAVLLAGCGNTPAPSSSESEPPSVSASESAPEPASMPSSVSESSSEPESEEPESESSVDEPEPASASSEASAPDVEKTPLYIDKSADFVMFALDPDALEYTEMGASWDLKTTDMPGIIPMNEIIDTINGLTGDGEAPRQPGAKLEASIMLLSGSYQKTIYDIYSDHILGLGQKFSYKLTPEQHERLLTMALNPPYDRGQAMWLVFMNPERIVSAICEVPDGDAPKYNVDLTNNKHIVANELIGIKVWDGKAYKPGSVDFAKHFVAKLTFDNGVVYTVALKGQDMFIESSDMSYACRYKTESAEMTAAYLSSPMAADANPATAKPVIYLYPESTTDISVTLDFDGKLATTIPAYNDGWHVAAAPDGTITNKSDGKMYPYLFWDGWANRTDWDFSSGFSVRGREVRAFLYEKLTKLGLNQREMREFIDYWAPEMSRNEWNLVAFSFEQYEQTAPLTITPKPDTLLRVHMIYRAVDNPVDIPAQNLPPAPQRTGFTVVEWGGTRA